MQFISELANHNAQKALFPCVVCSSYYSPARVNFSLALASAYTLSPLLFVWVWVNETGFCKCFTSSLIIENDQTFSSDVANKCFDRLTTTAKNVNASGRKPAAARNSSSTELLNNDFIWCYLFCA